MAILGAALLAASAAAQPRAEPPVQAEVPIPVDQASLALARTVVDHVWPVGTYERMMNGSMGQPVDAMMEAMFDMKPGDLGASYGDSPELAGKTMREIMEETDPHFRERLQIVNRVMMAEMLPLMNRLEPDIREGLARAYARKFSAAQLADLIAFFATPTGNLYASQSLLLFMDPEITSLMGTFATRLGAEMPRIIDKVKEATAHLPPPVAPPGSDRRPDGRRSD